MASGAMPAAAGRSPSRTPATGKKLLEIADATSADAMAALDAADAVQASWARTAPPRVRAEILRRGFELVTERAEDFALLMTLEMGKPPLAEHAAK